MSEKFKYAPGRPGFGTKGNDGSVGSQGLAMYFTDFDPVSDTTLINSRIANDFALWSANPPVSLPGGRVYVTGDLFFDSEGKAYEINAETDTYEYKFASLNMGGFFVPLGISSDQNYARYFNSNTSPKYIIDNVYTMSGGINYSQVPSNIYGIEPKNFARIEYSNIQFGNYIPFTVYTSGQTAISDDEKALAIVNDPSNNAFRIGNLDNGGGLRNVNLIFDVSSLVQTKNGNNTVTPSSPTGTVLTNYEIAANCLFDDNFNPNPSSFAGVYGSAGDGSIRWNLRDFTDDPDVTGTLYVYTNANPYNGQLIRFDSSLMRPLIFNNIDASGSIRLAGLTIPNVYSYYISINKNGWTRNSDIQSITGASLTVSPTTYASSSTGYEASVGFDVDSNVIWSYTIIPNPSNLIYNIRSASTGGLDGSIWFDVSVNDGIDKTFIMRITPYGGTYRDVSIYKPGSLITAWVDGSISNQSSYTYSQESFEQQDVSLYINNLPSGTVVDASVDILFVSQNTNSLNTALRVDSLAEIRNKNGSVLYSKSWNYYQTEGSYDSSSFTISITNVSTGSLPLKVSVISWIQYESDPGAYYASSTTEISGFNFKYKSGPNVYIQNNFGEGAYAYSTLPPLLKN